MPNIKKIFVNKGDTFGKLTVIKEVEPYIRPSGGKKRRVLCKCECGEETIVSLHNLTCGQTQSCGCLRKVASKKATEKSIENYYNKDIVGLKFNRLTVIQEEEPHTFPNGSKRRRFLCKCDCGNEVSVLLCNLRNGLVKSCGCLQKEQASKAQRKFNKYEVCGEITKVIDSNNNVALIDTSDLDKIKPFYFYKDVAGYFVASNTSLHRFVTDCPRGKVVDHINHDKADNRKCNLKICTQKDNNTNRPFIGIVFMEHINKWVASKKVGEKIVYSKQCSTIEEAYNEFKQL